MSAFAACFFDIESQSSLLIRWMTTGHRRQRVELRQHFFFGFKLATRAGSFFPMSRL